MNEVGSLYSIRIFFRENATVLTATWRTKEARDKAAADLGKHRRNPLIHLDKDKAPVHVGPDLFEMRDDFANVFDFDVHDISTTLCIDSGPQMEQAARLEYLQLRQQLRRNDFIKSDGELKAAMGMGRIAMPQGNA